MCRQLGYSTAPPTVQTGDYFPTPGGGGKLYHTAYCNGAEATLLACWGWKTDKDCVDHASVTCAPTKGKLWHIALPTSSQSWCGWCHWTVAGWCPLGLIPSWRNPRRRRILSFISLVPLACLMYAALILCTQACLLPLSPCKTQMALPHVPPRAG